MMKTYEHWIDADGHVLIPSDAPDRDRVVLLGVDARRCCTIRAATRDEVSRLYHEHLGWEPHRPMESAR